MFDFPTPPVLRTKRLVLRPITAGDLPAVFQGLSDPQVIVNYGVSYASLEVTQRQMEWFEQIFASGTGIWWAVCRSLEQPALMGAVGLNEIDLDHRRGEIGYWLLPAHWGRGIAHECASTVISFAFGALGMHRIGAEVDMDNHRSAALLERLHFKLEGVRRGCECKNGVFLDLRTYSRLATDPG